MTAAASELARMRTRRSGAAAMFALVAALAGCASPRGAADPVVPPVDGRSAYGRACASCHGTSGRGDGAAAGSLSQPVADLTTLTVRHDGRYPRQYVIEIVSGERELAAHGMREMPVWGRTFGAKPGTVAAVFRTERWLDAVASHVESLQRTGGAPDSQ